MKINLDSVIRLTGTPLTFFVGATMALSGILQFDYFLNSMQMQVIPIDEVILEDLEFITVHLTVGAVLMLYSLYVALHLYGEIHGGDDS